MILLDKPEFHEYPYTADPTETELKEFCNKVTEDWTPSDWDDITIEELHQHIKNCFYKKRLEPTIHNIDSFEHYMGW